METLIGRKASRTRKTKKAGVLRWTVAPAVTVFCILTGLLLSVQPAAAKGPKNPPIKVSLNHWQNGGLAVNPNYPKDYSWVNGDLNKIHNHYSEGDTVPYRFVFQNLKGNTDYLLTFEYETTKSQGGVSRHATDYLRTYDASEPNGSYPGPDPCDVLTEGNADITCNSTITLAIPPDPCVTARMAAAGLGGSQAPGLFTFYNVSDAAVDGPYVLTTGSGKVLNTCDYSDTTYTQITLSFKTDGNANETLPFVVMAVGGHIASFADWGVGLGAGSISGAPWHFRFTLLEDKGRGKVVADGNRDRSIMVNRISGVLIRKECTPGGTTGGPFDFEIALSDPSLNCGETTEPISVVFGSVVSITEDSLPSTDWSLTGINCYTQLGTTFDYDVESYLVSFAPVADDGILCIFTNDLGAGGGGGNGNKRRWMTGGGSVLDPAPNVHRVTHGFHLLCPNPSGKIPNASAKSNNLEVNWIDASTGTEYHFHLDGSTLRDVTCDSDGGDPRVPRTDWDRYTGTGDGLLNGEFATATWVFTDHGEPGRLKDGMTIDINNGFLVVTAPASNTDGNIESGNHQAH